MDPIEVEKLRAMAKYKKKPHFLHKIGICLLSTIMVGVFLSCPRWIPPLFCCIKSLALDSLPNSFGHLLCPKFLFVVSNMIVFILVGESKFLASPKTKPTVDIYDEYVKRQRGCHKLPTMPATKTEFHPHEEKSVIELPVVDTKAKENREMKKEELSEEEDDEEELQTQEYVNNFYVQHEYEGEETEEEEGDEEAEEEEEECDLPVDELNKRVEDFIARFNRLRRQEAELLISKG